MIKNSVNPALKKARLSNCNPVGYWKNEERNICLSYDDAAGSGNVLVPRRCKGGIEQKWARNGETICHPVEEKCLTPIYTPPQKKTIVYLLAYDGREDQTLKWNDDDITQLVTIEKTLA